MVINFVVPWGNFVCYFYRPDGSNGGALDLKKNNDSSEKLLKEFLEGDTVSSVTRTILMDQYYCYSPNANEYLTV